MMFIYSIAVSLSKNQSHIICLPQPHQPHQHIQLQQHSPTPAPRISFSGHLTSHHTSLLRGPQSLCASQTMLISLHLDALQSIFPTVTSPSLLTSFTRTHSVTILALFLNFAHKAAQPPFALSPWRYLIAMEGSFFLARSGLRIFCGLCPFPSLINSPLHLLAGLTPHPSLPISLFTIPMTLSMSSLFTLHSGAPPCPLSIGHFAKDISALFPASQHAWSDSTPPTPWQQQKVIWIVFGKGWLRLSQQLLVCHPHVCPLPLILRQRSWTLMMVQTLNSHSTWTLTRSTCFPSSSTLMRPIIRTSPGNFPSPPDVVSLTSSSLSGVAIFMPIF